jgi:hypothetical protein
VRPHRLLATTLLLLASAVACGPVYRATAQPSPGQGMVGVWALTDTANLLYNLRLEPDGLAASASGSKGPRAVGAEPLTAADLLDRGRWRAWGEGVRIDYGSGRSDAILPSANGPVQQSWASGSERGRSPTATGKAVRLSGPEAAVTGVYRIMPSEAADPPWLVSLLSSGVAYNTRDLDPLGSWRLEAGVVVVDWMSGWRIRLEVKPGGSFPARQWAPGADRQGPPSAHPQAVRL